MYNSTIKRKPCKCTDVTCSNCGVSFKKETDQVNRALKKQAKMFCSINCQRLGVAKNLTGLRFGRLLVIDRVFPNDTILYPKNRAVWRCVCDCGNERIVLSGYLVKGYSKSCGCHIKEVRYGQTKNSEYSTWRAMKNRCYDTDNEKYPDYGGRGITVLRKVA